MNRRQSIVSLIIAGVAGSVAVALAFARVAWISQTARSVARLYETSHADARPYSRDELRGLPDPVARYFEFALTPGQPLVRCARVEQTGEFAMRRDAWSPFTAVEYFAVQPPGFVWDARIRVAGLFPFFVRDGYVDGVGAMYGALAAIVSVVNERGSPPMASAELLRYVAEAVFFPTALLPRGGISWKPIDDRSAQVTFVDGPTTVCCDVEFRAGGEIAGVSAMRARDAHGTSALTRWVGHFRDYRRVEGMMIPMAGEVEWIMPDGPFPYWRGRIESARYQFCNMT